MEKIIEILVARDHISELEAYDICKKCKNEIHEIVSCGGTYEDAVECIYYWLGLEPDYLELLCF